MITQEYLKSKFDYDPETGILSRKNPDWRCKGGWVDHEGYLRFTVFGKDNKAHRLIWMYVNGEWPNQIDHINGVRTDNRICNLRNITHLENMKNQRIYKNNKSGVMGVYWDKDAGKWRACIRIAKKLYNLGYFKDLELAKELREFAAKECGFHENHGNKLTLSVEV